jgi:predicted nucleotidyltransferase
MATPRIEIPHREIAEFCKKHRIRRLAFFGSVLREDFGPDSDVDVLVEFEPGTTVGLRFFRIERELGEILGRRVDLITPGFLGKYLKDRILSQAHDEYVAA